MLAEHHHAREAATSATIEVWPLELDLEPHAVARLQGSLSRDEFERAERFHFRTDAQRFIAGRGQLRLILGELLERDPRELRFVYGEAGKPDLVGAAGLRFNLAHSHSLGLLATSRDAEIGADIEVGPPPPDACEEIAPRFFAPAETRALMALAPGDRDSAFLRCWTRKEAYVKALGDGLTLPLEDFVVSIAAQEPARLRWCRRAGELERWTLVDLSHHFDGAFAAACVGRAAVHTVVREVPG